MHDVMFLQDLAVVMLVAGAVTLLFHHLKQPVVLGYLVAGVIIGPHALPAPLVRNQQTIETLAELGVVFLMFSLGLEFNMRKLLRVGAPAMVTACFEILFMLLLGYAIGAAFGWGAIDRAFLGCILAISSTAIIVSHLRQSDELRTEHGQFIAGILVMEDIAVILMMVLLPGFAGTGDLPAGAALVTIVKLFVFLVGVFVAGLLLVPRLLHYAARFQSDELLLVTALGLCFGVSLLAAKLEYSVALGAFLVGAIVAESREAGRIAVLMAPVRDLFMAVFFVAIGMLINPAQVLHYAVPITVVAGLFVTGKLFACTLGVYLTGQSGATALRVGTHMAQLGEFGFVLATMGLGLGLTSDFLYPVVAAVTIANALVRPYLVEHADDIGAVMRRVLPGSMQQRLAVFNRWSRQVRRCSEAPQRAGGIARGLALQILVTVTLIAALYLAAGFLAQHFADAVRWVPASVGGPHTLMWLAATGLALPMYVAGGRKMQALAMLVAEMAVREAPRRSMRAALRRWLTNVLLLGQLILLGMLTLLSGAALLPPWQTLMVTLAMLAVIVVVFRRRFNAVYSQGKFALIEALREIPSVAPPAAPPEVPALLKDAHLVTVRLKAPSLDGRLIRESELRSRTGVSIVAVERGGSTQVNPGPDSVLRLGDGLLLLGAPEQIERAREILDSKPAATASLIDPPEQTFM